MKYVKVPDDNIPEKKINRLSEDTKSNIVVNENENIQVQNEDSVVESDVSEAIRSLSMGFEYREAIQLVENPEARLREINMKDYTRNEKDFRRQKGRVIGKNGKARRVISDLANVSIKIVRDVVGIIGKVNDVLKAREAVIKILNGTPHSYIYKNLEEYQKKKNMRAFRNRN